MNSTHRREPRRGLTRRAGAPWAAALGCLLLLAFGPSAAPATTLTWSGGHTAGASDWSKTANWGGVDGSGGTPWEDWADVIFYSSGAVALTNYLDSDTNTNDRPVTSLTFNSLADSNVTISYGTAGVYGALPHLIIGAGGLTVDADAGGTHRISAPIDIAASQTWNLNNTSVPLEINGVISESAGGPYTLTITGGGILSLLSGAANVGPTHIVIDNGEVRYATSNRIADTTDVTINGSSKLNLNGYSDAIRGIQGGASAQVTDINGTLDLRPQAGDNFTFSGSITQKSGGTMNLLLEATRTTPNVSGTQTITTVSPHTGYTRVYNGTLRLYDNGTAKATSSANNYIYLGREDIWAGLGNPSGTDFGTVWLDNSGINNSDRLSDTVSRVYMRDRSEIKMTGNASAPTTEVIGALLVTSGRPVITLDARPSQLLTLKPSSFSYGYVPYLAEGHLATLLVRGDNVGSPTTGGLEVGHLQFNSTPGTTKSISPSNPDRGILPYFIVDTNVNGTGIGTSVGLATYDTTTDAGGPSGSRLGVRALKSSEYNLNSFYANQNTLIAQSAATVSSSIAIHGLMLNYGVVGSSTTLTINPGQTLTVQGGALLSAGDLAGPANTITGGTLTFGDNIDDASTQNTLTGYNGFIHLAKDLTISTLIANNGAGIVDLCISGPKTLTLTTATAYTGSTSIVGGATFKTTAPNLLPDGGVYFVDEGFFVPGGNETIGALSGYGTGEVQIGSGITLTVKTDAVSGNRSYDFTGNLTGTGTLRVEGNRPLRIDPTGYKLTGTTTPLILAGDRRAQNVNDGTTSQFGFINFVGAGEGAITVDLGNVRFLGDAALVNNVNSSTASDRLDLHIDTATIAAGGDGVLHYQGQYGYRTELTIDTLSLQQVNPTLISSSYGVVTLKGTVESSGAGVNQTLTLSSGDYGRGLIRFGTQSNHSSVDITHSGPIKLVNNVDVEVWKPEGIPSTTDVIVTGNSTLNLYGDGFGIYALPQSITLQDHGALAADLFNAVYSGGSGAGQNVFLAAGTTLLDLNFGGPTYPTATAAGGSTLYLGMDVNLMDNYQADTQVDWLDKDGPYGPLGDDIVGPGDDTQNPFMGIAFGRFSSVDSVIGTHKNPYWRSNIWTYTGKPVEVYIYPSRETVVSDATGVMDVSAGNQIQFRSVASWYDPGNPVNSKQIADGPSMNTDTRTANIRGSGELYLYADGDANKSISLDAIQTNQTLDADHRFTLNRYGDQTQNRNHIIFGRAAAGGYALPEFWTANVWDGRALLVNVNSETALAPTAIVNMMDGGTWVAHNTGPSQGTVNLMQGSMLNVRGDNKETDTEDSDTTADYVNMEDLVANGGTQHIFLDATTTDGLLNLDPDSGVTMDLRGTASAPMVQNMDLLIGDGDAQRFLGLTLGDGKRLTTAMAADITISSTFTAPDAVEPTSDEITDNAPDGLVYITAAGDLDNTKRQIVIYKNVNFGNDTDLQIGDTNPFRASVSGGDTRRLMADQDGVVYVNANLTARDVTVAAGIFVNGQDGSGNENEYTSVNSLTVKDGAFLMGRRSSTVGNHRIVATNGVTVELGGTINPGYGATQYALGAVQGLGTLAVEGNVTFMDGAILTVQLNSYTTNPGNPNLNYNDVLDVSGTLTLAPGAILNVQIYDDFTPLLAYMPSDTRPYVIAKYGSLSGTFGTENVQFGPGYGIDYNYKNLNVIAVVPEPSALALATIALAALGLGAAARRRRAAR